MLKDHLCKKPEVGNGTHGVLKGDKISLPYTKLPVEWDGPVSWMQSLDMI